MPSRSSHIPDWNSRGSLATETLAEKRRRHFQGQEELQNNLHSEFAEGQPQE